MINHVNFMRGIIVILFASPVLATERTCSSNQPLSSAYHQLTQSSMWWQNNTCTAVRGLGAIGVLGTLYSYSTYPESPRLPQSPIALKTYEGSDSSDDED